MIEESRILKAGPRYQPVLQKARTEIPPLVAEGSLSFIFEPLRSRPLGSNDARVGGKIVSTQLPPSQSL